MQLIVAHFTRIYLYLSIIRSDILIFNFGRLLTGHVSKIIRGCFSNPEGVRKQKR